MINPNSRRDMYKDIGHYYDDNTEDFYGVWNNNHIHFGFFDSKETSDASIETAAVRMIDKIVGEKPQIQKGDLVVDAGCGVGGTAIYLAKKYQCKVIGVNLSRRQIDIAREKVKKLRLTKEIQFKYADCSISLPFSDNSVDAIINIDSACYYKDIDRFLSECYRVLKPGRWLAASDWMKKEQVSPLNHRKFLKPVIDNWFLHDLRSLKNYEQLLARAQFCIEEMEYVDKNISQNILALKSSTFFFSISNPKYPMWYGQLTSLAEAWEKGYFQIGRYRARK